MDATRRGEGAGEERVVVRVKRIFSQAMM